jgi:ribonuclease D
MDKYMRPAGNELPYQYVKDKTDLKRISEIFSKTKIIGVDLESDSMFHYKEKVCLMQISIPGTNILVDTLSVNDLAPLLPIFSDQAIRKIFHGADYDIRCLSRDFGIEVNSLFDTQIAARFLGMPQTGLSPCIESLFGISMEKKYQKKDWSIRPLPEEMLQYAVKDTYYLLPFAEKLENELEVKGRLSWVEEECELLSKVRASPAGMDPLYLKFKGASKLDPRSLAVLDEILKWRDASAVKRDVPPFKILGNHQVLELVEEKPVSIEELTCLSTKQVNRFGRSILDAIIVALAIPESELPAFRKEKRSRQNAIVSKKIDVLKEWRERLGKQLEIDSSIICPNSLIRSIATMDACTAEGLEGLTEMRKWQMSLFGEEVCKLMNSIKTDPTDAGSDK